MMQFKLVLLSLSSVLLFLSLSTGPLVAQTPERTVGLLINEPGTYDGYNLFTPNSNAGNTTYLINNSGKVVHTWPQRGTSVYLRENGNLLSSYKVETHNHPNVFVGLGGPAGGIRETDWDGNVVWEFEHCSETYITHHDYELMPNGNILMIAWEVKTYEEVIAAGRNDTLDMEDAQLWPEKIIEVRPADNAIVWEWHVWDHIIQDFDVSKLNYGVVGDHPELIDLNYSQAWMGRKDADWQHANSIDYNPDLDQILISCRSFDEIWIIDHSTSTAQAKSHSGGNSGKGGDLLYRWGNPFTYGVGSLADRQLFNQHNATWIEPGYPGAGNIMIFNNGRTRPEPEYSAAVEIIPPVNGWGYDKSVDGTFGPVGPEWFYQDPPEFYSSIISSAQRLPNGNTVICEGTTGTFWEVTSVGDVVWKYISPIIFGVQFLSQGDTLPPGMPAFGGSRNLVFRVLRYGPDFPGFDGKDLTPGGPLEQYLLLLADKKIKVDKISPSLSFGSLHSNDKIELKKVPTTYTGNITAVGKIDIKKNITIDGDVFAGGKLKLGNNVTITGTYEEYADVDSVDLPSFSFSAGGENIKVKKNKTKDLLPGTYGKVEVENNGILKLITGEYLIEKLKFKKDVKLELHLQDGPITINVEKKVDFAKDVEIILLGEGEVNSKSVNINSLEDIKVDKNSIIYGSLNAPEGKVQLKQGVKLKGSISAEEIKIDKNCVLLHHYSPLSLAKTGNLATGEDDVIPNSFSLAQNYPNPFNPSTKIRYRIKESVFVSLKVYDVLGREVAALVNHQQKPGFYEVDWHAVNNSSGIYFYIIQAGDFVETKKMVLLR